MSGPMCLPMSMSMCLHIGPYKTVATSTMLLILEYAINSGEKTKRKTKRKEEKTKAKEKEGYWRSTVREWIVQAVKVNMHLNIDGQ